MLIGGDQPDILLGGTGSDSLEGGSGSDQLFGEVGSDTLRGGNGDNLLEGGHGSDSLLGGTGSDTLHGGMGNDTMSGGLDADTFVFKDFVGGFGHDTITDFKASALREVINLKAVASVQNFSDLVDNHMSQIGEDVIIDLLGGSTITLHGVVLSDLSSDDFSSGSPIVRHTSWLFLHCKHTGGSSGLTWPTSCRPVGRPFLTLWGPPLVPVGDSRDR